MMVKIMHRARGEGKNWILEREREIVLVLDHTEEQNIHPVRPFPQRVPN